ncbi:hypothetical protein DFP72DRAFT_806177 [Ephemerocybe angulata]|uniref:Uncharacterized protein n=1 Tax=Ephemerocybe angulata TaxID=980116 RepID=A0A8H6MBL2_9AGAR|nr:hypothetical protein DFP72DRAFT_806177 [Tulosesus angulatus]
MYSTLITAVALFVVPALAGFAINNPDLKQCSDAKISWEPTKGPYNIIAVDAADPCGEPLAEIGDFADGTSKTTWKVTIPAGTVVQLSIADANDNEAWSGNLTVGAGPSDCLTTNKAASTSTASISTATGSTTSGTTAGDSTSGDSTIVPVGAANAGTNKFLDNAAAPRSLNGPVIALSALAAVAALAL